jgi:hypothetical protein
MFSLYFLISVVKKHHTCKSKVVPTHSMKTYTGKRGRTPFLNWGLDGDEWLTSCPGRCERTAVPNEHKAGWALELVWIFWIK